jgi:hypothetical protein
VNPFAVLGLPARPGLTDDQVRTAWRAIAAATHPDRPDGGNPARYAAATAAYTQLRTPWQRSEALADLASVPVSSAGPPPPAPAGQSTWQYVALLPARIRYGRPVRLVLRALAAAAVAVTALVVIPGTASAPAIVTGCALWWVLTGRGDLAPPPGQ